MYRSFGFGKSQIQFALDLQIILRGRHIGLRGSRGLMDMDNQIDQEIRRFHKFLQPKADLPKICINNRTIYMELKSLSKPILPKKKWFKPTLVLDLDNTLIYSSNKPLENYDAKSKVKVASGKYLTVSIYFNYL